jgi:ketosteroid isomerase-like protein
LEKKMKSLFLGMLVAGLMGGSAMAVSAAPCESGSEPEVRAVLEKQAVAWNQGDVETFMIGYENAETTTFVGSTVTKGYKQVLERYRQRYASKEKMGQLTFLDLEVKPMGCDYASALGRWQLIRSKEAGGNVGGFFTLLLRRTESGWKIFLDHTS